MKKKKPKKVFCHYRKAWIPLGRARKKCPSCGAIFPSGGHKIA